MKDAMIRIDELQQEMINKSKSIEGAQQYIDKKLELYDKEEELREQFHEIHLQEEEIASKFFTQPASIIKAIQPYSSPNSSKALSALSNCR